MISEQDEIEREEDPRVLVLGALEGVSWRVLEGLREEIPDSPQEAVVLSLLEEVIESGWVQELLGRTVFTESGLEALGEAGTSGTGQGDGDLAEPRSLEVLGRLRGFLRDDEVSGVGLTEVEGAAEEAIPILALDGAEYSRVSGPSEISTEGVLKRLHSASNEFSSIEWARLLQEYLEDREDPARLSAVIEANLGLVRKFQRRHAHRLVEEEAFLLGLGGLVRCLEKFDSEMGYQLSTYSGWWIPQAVSRGEQDWTKMPRVPVHAQETLRAWRRVWRDLFCQDGRPPEPARVCEETGRLFRKKSTPKQVWIQSEVPRSLSPEWEIYEESLQETLPEAGGGTLEEEALGAVPGSESWVAQEFLSRIEGLKPREPRIFRARCGLGIPGGQTLQELGDEFNVTRERIRQLQNKALKRLRKRIGEPPKHPSLGGGTGK